MVKAREPANAKSDKEQRLAEKLKDNLRRRKEVRADRARPAAIKNQEKF